MFAALLCYLSILYAMFLWLSKPWGCIAARSRIRRLQARIAAASESKSGLRILRGSLHTEHPMLSLTGDAGVIVQTSLYVVEDRGTESVRNVGFKFWRKGAACTLRTDEGEVALDLSQATLNFGEMGYSRSHQLDETQVKKLAPDIVKEFPLAYDYDLSEWIIPEGAEVWAIGVLSNKEAAHDASLQMTSSPNGPLTLSGKSPGEVLVGYPERILLGVVGTIALTLYGVSQLLFLIL